MHGTCQKSEFDSLCSFAKRKGSRYHKKIAMRQFCENEEGRKNKNDLKMFISKIVIFVSRPKNAFFSFESEFSGRGSAESL
jgi:hypothetical protein